MISKLWNWANGKKTAIGLGLHAVLFVSNIAFKDLMTQEQSLYGHGIIFSATGVGIGHKINKKINNANSVLNK